MKKNDVLERLKLASNLIEQANAVLAGVEKAVFPEVGDDNYDAYCDYINDLRDGEDPEVVFDTLYSDGFLSHMDEGDTEPYPVIAVNAGYPRLVDVHVPLDGGESYLTAFTGEADYGTYQAGVIYSDKDKVAIHDLAFAERPRGDLAKLDGLDPDGNKKLFIRVYENPENEDWTQKLLFDPDKIPAE